MLHDKDTASVSPLPLSAFADNHFRRGEEEAKVAASLLVAGRRGDRASEAGLDLGWAEALERFGGHSDLKKGGVLSSDAEELVLMHFVAQSWAHQPVNGYRLDRGLWEDLVKPGLELGG